MGFTCRQGAGTGAEEVRTGAELGLQQAGSRGRDARLQQADREEHADPNRSPEEAALGGEGSRRPWRRRPWRRAQVGRRRCRSLSSLVSFPSSLASLPMLFPRTGIPLSRAQAAGRAPFPAVPARARFFPRLRAVSIQMASPSSPRRDSGRLPTPSRRLSALGGRHTRS